MFGLQPKDESIQSFIFRVSINSGYLSIPADIQNILDSTGYWRRIPKIDRLRQHLFQDFEERLLANLVKSNYVTAEDCGLFANPIGYISILKYVFFNGGACDIRAGKYKIKYCLDCIKESIYKYGFGYFPVHWLNTSYCAVHQSFLHCVKSKTRAESFAAIQYILKGMKPPDYTSCCDIEDSCNIYGDNVRNVDLFKVKFAPCLKAALLHWLRKHLREIDDATARRAHLQTSDMLLRQFVCTSGLYKKVNDIVIERLFVAMQPKYNEQLKSFLVNNAEIIRIKCGIKNVVNLTEQLAITKGNTCGSCTKYNGSCPAAPKLITLWRLGGRANSYKRNPCDYFLTYFCY